MFGFFKKKEKKINIEDRIWMTTQAKWQACADLYEKDKTTLFIAWFEDSRRQLETFFSNKGIGDAHIKNATFSGIVKDSVVFIEHFPLEEEEQSKFRDMGLQVAIIYSSLDEPIFRLFRGEKIIELMRKMGMKEHEMLEHGMISTAIKRAQEKIATKTIISGSARSQADWLSNAGIDLPQ